MSDRSEPSPTRRRSPATLAARIPVLLVAAACIPYWTPGSTLVASSSDGYVVIDWPAAIDEDDPEGVEQYEIEVDGVHVATVAHPATECALIGLAASTEYDIEVFAEGKGD